ncbi:MAG TPA: hypothetical protein VGM01_09800 [Ktedonobacteraceae bacterium]|jgi:hypothetical protein
MNKRITIEAHLDLEAIETHYRKAKDAVERSQWQIIWLLAQQKTTQEVAEVTGYSCPWITPTGSAIQPGGSSNHGRSPS